MIGQRPPAAAAQFLSQFFGAAPRGAIDDAAFPTMGIEPFNELAGCIRFRSHREKKIRAVERTHEHLRLADEQFCGDFLTRRCVGGGRHGDRLEAAEGLDGAPQLQVFGPEVVTPLRHAMGFIDGDAIDRRIAQVSAHVVAQQSLGRNVEQAQRPLADAPRDPAALLDFRRGIDAAGLDSQFPQLGDLVPHEGDQRRNHQRQAFTDNRRKLEAERFAAAGRHDSENVLSFQDGRQDLLLTRTEGREAVDARQRFASFGHERRLLAHLRPLGVENGGPLHGVDPSCARRQHGEAVEPERGAARVGHLTQSLEEILVDRRGRPINSLLLGHVGFEPAPLLVGVAQFMESIGELDAAAVQLETFGCARIVGARLRKRRFARGILGEESSPSPLRGWARRVR